MNLLDFVKKISSPISCEYIPSRNGWKWIAEIKRAEVFTVGGSCKIRGSGNSPIEALQDYSDRISKRTIVKFQGHGNTVFEVPKLEQILSQDYLNLIALENAIQDMEQK